MAQLERLARRRTASPTSKPAGSLRFKLYDQVIQAAVGGQGVALGRVPLIAEHAARRQAGRAVRQARTSRRAATSPCVAPHAADRADVAGVRRAGCSDEAARAFATSMRRRVRDGGRRARSEATPGRRPMHAVQSRTGLAPSPWIARFAHARSRRSARARPRLRVGPTRALLRRARRARARGRPRRAALAALAGCRRASTIRQADLEAGPWPLARRALRRHRRQPTTCTARCSRTCSRRSPATARCSTRRSRAATRPTDGRRIRTFCSRPANCCFARPRRGRLTVVAFEQGQAERAGRPAVMQRHRRRRRRARLAAGPDGCHAPGIAVATRGRKPAQACTAPNAGKIALFRWR